jgi:hypothetical protein
VQGKKGGGHEPQTNLKRKETVKPNPLSKPAAVGSTPPPVQPTTPAQTPTVNLLHQLLEAEELLSSLGWKRGDTFYEPQPPGDAPTRVFGYKQTKEAAAKSHREEVFLLDPKSYQFRDLVRAGDKAALDRLAIRGEWHLWRLADEFDLAGGDFVAEANELVTELLIRFIEDEAEGDAELKKEDEEEARKILEIPNLREYRQLATEEKPEETEPTDADRHEGGAE